MPTRGNNLLVVDDEAPIRYLLTQILGGMGYDVQAAEDGFAALKIIHQSPPDIILSDLNMPGMSGFELLSVVRRRLPGIYVIATSGAYTGDSIPPGIAADAFYEKATGVGALLTIVSKAVEANPVDARTKSEPIPIWICAEESDPAIAEKVVINCPECLRNSALSGAESSRAIHLTKCAHCGGEIQYAIVRPMDATTSLANLPGLRPDSANTSEEARESVSGVTQAAA